LTRSRRGDCFGGFSFSGGKKSILVTDHNKFTVSTGDEAGMSSRGTFTIDPTKTPKTGDSSQAEGPDKSKTLYEIYEIIDENHKRACWAPLGKTRRRHLVRSPGAVTFCKSVSGRKARSDATVSPTQMRMS
jgi:uncharacterized protein (TIGR03067 family)